MNRYRTFLQICRFIYGIVWALIDLAFYSKYVRIKLHSMLQPFQQSVAGFISIITLLFSLQRWHEFRIWLRNYPKKIWLLQRLNNSKTYEEWGQYANALDYYYGADKWYVKNDEYIDFLQMSGTLITANILI